MRPHKVAGIAGGLGVVVLLAIVFLISRWQPGYVVWCHNPLSVPVLLQYNRNQRIPIQPWAFVRVNLSRGTHPLEVLSASGTAHLDSAEVTLPAPEDSAIIYSIQGLGTYVLGEALEDGKEYRNTVLRDQRILFPGKVGEPLLPGGGAATHLSRWIEFAPTQRLVLAEEARNAGDWSGMLHHGRAAQKTFAPSAGDSFLAFSQALESRALANLGRMDDAVLAARTLASATPANLEGATLAQNLLLNYLSPREAGKDYRSRMEQTPNALNRALLGRIEPDLEKARGLLLEAATDGACAHAATEFFLQRWLWEGDIRSARELADRLIAEGTAEEDDFLRTTQATCQLLSGVTPETAFRAVERILPGMDEPLSLVPWFAAAAAQVGEVSSAMGLLAGVDWSGTRGTEPGPPTLLYWRTQILLRQEKPGEARALVEQVPRIQNVWDMAADLDTALAALPPNKALRVLEARLDGTQPILDPYRLAGYHLAHECGLDEIGRQILSPYAKRETGSPERVIWEILEGDGWPPERLLGFMVQHAPQETNDVVYALGLRALLDGDRMEATALLDRCIGYPPVPEFPSILAARGKGLLR